MRAIADRNTRRRRLVRDQAFKAMQMFVSRLEKAAAEMVSGATASLAHVLRSDDDSYLSARHCRHRGRRSEWHSNDNNLAKRPSRSRRTGQFCYWSCGSLGWLGDRLARKAASSFSGSFGHVGHSLFSGHCAIDRSIDRVARRSALERSRRSSRCR